MERPQIVGTIREKRGKGPSRSLRKQGMIPAVAYGPALEKPLNLAIPSRDVALALSKAGGLQIAVDLKLGERKYLAVIKDFAVATLSRSLLHCDFYVPKPDGTVELKVPVVIQGKSKGEREGGKLFLARREVQVKCKASAIPDAIVVDVTDMAGGSVLYVTDLPMPEGVRPVFKSRYPVVVLKAPKRETEGAGAAGEARGEGAAAESAARTGEGLPRAS